MNKCLMIFLIVLAITYKYNNKGHIMIVYSPFTYKEMNINMISEQENKIQELLKRKDDLELIPDNKEWFVAYKTLIEEYSEWCDPPENIYDVFTEDEICLMLRCIETEAYGCDFDSKCNVASVILNRIECELFVGEVIDIITTPRQFAYGRKNITEDTILALEYAFMVEDTSNGALFFHSNDKTETFCNASYIFTDNAGHHFYGNTER